MIEFRYSGRSRDGAMHSGVVHAVNMDAARLSILSKGLTPVEVTSSTAAQRPSGAKQPGMLSRQDILFFTRELTHLKQSRVPLDKALGTLKEIAASESLKQFVQSLDEGIRGGHSLHQALMPYEAILGKRYLALVRAGEASGALTEILTELLAQMESDDKLRNHLISALTYPMILLGVAVGSVAMLLVFVVPQFRQIFDAMGEGLPYLTRLVLGLSDALRHHWYLILMTVLFAGLVFRKWRKSVSGRQTWDAFILRIPFLGLVVKNLQFSMYFRTLGTLIHRKVPMIDALNIASEVLTNAALRQSVDAVPAQVKSGGRLSKGFSAYWFQVSTVPQLIRVAEETGRLDATLQSLANRFEDEGRRVLTRTLAAMEPLIIVLLGVLVAVIIISILSGVLSINDTI